ncbi:MAG: hypothetical protein PWP01_905 [Methanosarcinales archaeon]|nr:hypothetical protein [Methanosarcinales archaeon]
MDEGSRRIVWGLCASLFLILLVSSCAAAQTDYPIAPADSVIQNALNSLKVNQSADGKIVSDSTTAWAVMAFASAGIDPHTLKTSPTSPSAVDYLLARGDSLSSATDYARQILALSAAGEPADKYVQTLLTYFDGTQFGDAGGLNDDIYALLALCSVGMNTGNSTVNTTLHYIKSHQNADGGWSWSLSSTSDTDTTAAAILALLAAGEPQSSSTITNALAFIKSRQNSDGGFGWDATYTQSNGDSDAYAIMAIWAAGQDPTSAEWTKGYNPVEHLLSLQRPDGSFAWNGTGDSTPDAIVALLGKFYPLHGFTNHLRVEGKNATLFEGDVFYTVPYVAIADNSGDAFDAFTEPCVAAQLETMNDSFGIPVYTTDAYGNYFVVGIAGENNSGADGWQYAVNYGKASVSAEDCVLKPGDGVVWYYGSQQAVLSALMVPEVVQVNRTFVAHALYYNQSRWMPLEGAYVWANGAPIAGPTNASGAVSMSFNASGNYTLWCAGAQTADYPGGDWRYVIRSEKVMVNAGIPPIPVAAVRHAINNVDSPVFFNGSGSYDPDGSIVSWVWDFGDGTWLHTNNSTTSHVYTHYMWNNGSYAPFMVNMTVYDNASAYNYTHIPVMVYMAGDANGDGVSNILDASLVGLHWNSHYGNAAWVVLNWNTWMEECD